MALTPIEQVRFLIGLGPNSPFDDFVTNEEIEWALETKSGNILQAAKIVAISLSMQLSGVPTRERTSDIEVWNSISTSYIKALDYFIKNPDISIPGGLFPWFGSKDSCSKLLNISICDHEDSCGCQSCNAKGSVF